MSSFWLSNATFECFMFDSQFQFLLKSCMTTQIKQNFLTKRVDVLSVMVFQQKNLVQNPSKCKGKLLKISRILPSKTYLYSGVKLNLSKKTRNKLKNKSFQSLLLVEIWLVWRESLTGVSTFCIYWSNHNVGFSQNYLKFYWSLMTTISPFSSIQSRIVRRQTPNHPMYMYCPSSTTFHSQNEKGKTL